MHCHRSFKLLALGLFSFAIVSPLAGTVTAQSGRPSSVPGPSTARPQTKTAQQPARQPQAGTPRPESSGVRQVNREISQAAHANVQVRVSPEVEEILVQWEKNSSKVQRLRGAHQRYVYDNTFQVEKRSEGKFWFEYPDKGRIDFDPPETESTQGAKQGPNGQPYSLQPDAAEKWICDGEFILQIDEAAKTYNRFEIPPKNRGENIMDAPLPFLFGMKAEKAKQRYHLTLGSMHNPDGKKAITKADGTKVSLPIRIHIVAKPKRADIAQEWSRAEVLLDTQYYMPLAIRLYNPAGTTETAYIFDRNELKANESKLKWLPSPFNYGVSRYKLLQNVQAKGDNADTPGRATIR